VTSYLGVVLLIGLVGGVAMASIAGARRTESSFPTYVASTNPSTVATFTMYRDPELGLNSGYVPTLANIIQHLPFVTRAVDAIIFDGNIDLPSVTGIHPHSSAGEAPPTIIGSADGEFTSMDRVTAIAGRLPGSHDVDTAIINAQAAQQLGVHVGSVVHFPFYSNAEIASPKSFPPSWFTVTIVGEFVASRDVIESDIARLNSAEVIFSPALTGELESRYATGTETFLQTAVGTGPQNKSCPRSLPSIRLQPTFRARSRPRSSPSPSRRLLLRRWPSVSSEASPSSRPC
jgi:hypothetical protein